MAANMTKDEMEIRKMSGGFASGKLYVGSTSEEIRCISNFDKKTYNFHMYPVDYELTCSVSEEIKEKRMAVQKALERLCNSGGIKALGTDLEFNQETRKQKTGKNNVIYISGKSVGTGGAGKRGNVAGCKEAGNLFRYIRASKNGIIYELNFMRFFVDDSKGEKTVNCILKAIQFDRCMEKTVNQFEGGCDICYPCRSDHQTDGELENVLKRREGRSFCFNPMLEFDDAEKIAEKFICFIHKSDAFGRN